MVDAIEPAVRLYEEPPTESLEVETPWADVLVTARDWAEAFDSCDPGTPHNLARDDVWQELLTIVADKLDSEDVSPDDFRTVLRPHGGLREAFDRAWPLIEATDLVGDLWTVPAYLRMCAPWLGPDEVTTLRRRDPDAWTVRRPAAARRGPAAPGRPGGVTATTPARRPPRPGSATG